MKVRTLEDFWNLYPEPAAEGPETAARPRTGRPQCRTLRRDELSRELVEDIEALFGDPWAAAPQVAERRHDVSTENEPIDEEVGDVDEFDDFNNWDDFAVWMRGKGREALPVGGSCSYWILPVNPDTAPERIIDAAMRTAWHEIRRCRKELDQLGDSDLQHVQVRVEVSLVGRP